jgi:glucose-6-phosphate 1-dehydrogenase
MPSCIGLSVAVSVATPAPFRKHRVCGALGTRGYALVTESADALVVFGITGDLARRMTIPALYRLTEQEILTCTVLSVGRRPLRDDELGDLVRKAVEVAVKDVDEAVLSDLLSRLSYIAGDVDDPALYERLRDALGSPREPVFYLAIPPGSFLDVAEGLAAADLVENARLVVEKPFGTDLRSARELNTRLTAIVPEERVYRIDHFLGKEPVQDIIYIRFANALFEPVWSREDVDSIQITLAEDFGVEGRGSFYDGVGAIRDVVQNHLLQVLALAAMEPPSGGDDAIQRRRLDVFRSMPEADPEQAVRGQYKGYREIEGVEPDSDTETFVALTLEIESWRWANVPILIRAGKALPVNGTEVVVRLERVPQLRWGSNRLDTPGSDDIVLRVGRNAGVTIGIRAKTPGRDVSQPVSLDLDFEEELGEPPEPYERLLADALRGDSTLFPRFEVIEETWRIVQPLLDSPPPLEPYERGTWGPESAEKLAEAHGGWREPQAETT